MGKNITKLLSVTGVALIMSLNIGSLTANAVVSCGGSGDGHRCHYQSTVGTPPPMYHTFGDKVMNYGVGAYGSNTRYYWIDTALPSSYTSPIQTAFDEWVYTTSSIGVTTSISIHQTNTRSAAYFEMIEDNTLPSGTLARTEFYIYSTQVTTTSGALDSNYGWTQIHINADYIDSKGYGSTQKQSTAAHEIGHGMGLSHQNCRTSSIMCQTGQGRTATRADVTDLNTINHLYG